MIWFLIILYVLGFPPMFLGFIVHDDEHEAVAWVWTILWPLFSFSVLVFFLYILGKDVYQNYTGKNRRNGKKP